MKALKRVGSTSLLDVARARDIMGRVDWPRRILTVLVGIPTALKLLSSDIGMWCLASTLCCFSIVEFATNIAPRIAPHPQGRLHAVWLGVLGVLVCTAAWSGQKLLHDAALTVAVVATCGLHITTLSKVDLPALSAMLLDLFAFSYIVSGFSHAILLRYATTYGFGYQILGLSCAWVCDSGALIAGNLLGHKKLAPVVSPGKTIVGAAAGVLSSVATVLAFFHLPSWLKSASSTSPGPASGAFDELLPMDVSIAEQIALGLVVGVLCILGDLVESLLKRVADVKDSGAFFPGHGGCLDRMDSFLFVAQALFYYSHFRFAHQ